MEKQYKTSVYTSFHALSLMIRQLMILNNSFWDLA
jgi:hypothetical protein